MALNLREIVAISGRSGLYRVISPARNGILVESLDEPRARTLVPAQQQVSSLGDISIYTTTDEGTVGLGEVLQAIRRLHGPSVELTAKSEPQALVTFIRQAVPDYDADRVYLSDIKKLVTWYNILGPHLPDETSEAATAELVAETHAVADERAGDAPVKKGKKAQAAEPEIAAQPDTEGLSTGGAVPPQAPDAAEGKPVVQ
ncbi:MAG: DUF5606 domain-containing protein [Hymenobacteraceae bacterium]|nr:DUF5606 domain-containing protein [Hymenobacteraceae bacterium]